MSFFNALASFQLTFTGTNKSSRYGMLFFG